ncbi:sodium:proline symporter [Halobacteriales archaeon QS_8_65_32]|nr:MAG: sodium:proline symporter [Halobacteriales archaeon QS_8_65_32]
MVTSTTALGFTVLTLAVFAGAGIRYSRGRVGSVEEFITARDSAGVGTLTATLIASSMGAWILFSPAEAGAAFGGISAVAGYGAGSALALVVFAFVGPRIRDLIPEGHSLTEYALARYGRAFYAYVLAVSVLYMFVFLAAEMTGIAGALSLVAGVPTWQTASLIGVFVLAYTAYGGLEASIFTDTLQTLVVLPLLAIGFAGALLALGGTGEIYRSALATNPDLLNPSFLPGVEFGAYVVIAIVGAEMLNQAWWQRVYAAEGTRTLRRSFLIAALAVLPMILLAGLFGLAAAGLGLVRTGANYNADIAFFLVLQEAFPEWVVLAVVLLAVLLVTSTADTLFNAIASVVTADLPRVLDDPSRGTLTTAARALTGVVAVGAVWVGAQGYSVLELFLTADLLAAATFLPLLAGLYTGRLTGVAALSASLAGLAVGLAFFPTLHGPVSVLVPAAVLPAASFLASFLGAALVSGGLALLAARATTGRYDLGRLGREIGRFDEDEPAADGGVRRPLDAGESRDTAETRDTTNARDVRTGRDDPTDEAAEAGDPNELTNGDDGR